MVLKLKTFSEIYKIFLQRKKIHIITLSEFYGWYVTFRVWISSVIKNSKEKYQ